jgi:hypothetical protein
MVYYVAIIGAGIVSMVIGALWYSPLLFGKKWMELMNFQKKDMAKMKKQAQKGYAIMFLTTLVMGFVLSKFLDNMGAVTAIEGIVTAFWLWLGFIATMMLSSVIWEGKPLQLYLINALHSLVSLAAMGAILAVWV